jgi:hypothetical protein
MCVCIVYLHVIKKEYNLGMRIRITSKNSMIILSQLFNTLGYRKYG